MSVLEFAETKKKEIAAKKREKKFKRDNKARKEAAVDLDELTKCNAQLGKAKRSLKMTIVDLSGKYREARAAGIDSPLLKQEIGDAAVGYMLVREALYRIKAIHDSDAIAHAYEMLFAACEQMKGHKNSHLDLPVVRPIKTRTNADYITSDEAIEEYSSKVENFIDELVESGDIDACIEKQNREENGGSGSSGKKGDGPVIDPTRGFGRRGNTDKQ